MQSIVQCGNKDAQRHSLHLAEGCNREFPSFLCALLCFTETRMANTNGKVIKVSKKKRAYRQHFEL